METIMTKRFENHFIENREIRVFLSSTFSDMDDERSALVKLFHKLKLEASQRNVALTLLDLRWGVTDEESRTGKVLSVCLNEIENSHPFFIGLLGSRYGYTPKASELEKNPDLKERYPWITNDISDGMSITEIEMQYGVLRNHEEMDAAIFIKSTPDALPDDNNKLTTLKSTIREQKRFLVGEYKSIPHLCEQIEKVVMGLLDKYFSDSGNTRLGRERNIQQAYINSRHRFYVPRQRDFDRLNMFLNSNERYLVVTGKSGMGKSALIANWLKDLERNQSRPYNIIYHFVGNSFGGNSYNDVLQHISDELFELYDGFELRMGNNESLEDKAQRYMTEAAQKGGKPMLIVIDGINQIDDSAQSKLLNWLPQSTQKVKYLFSTLEDDETMQTFLRREFPVYTLEPLEKKGEFIDEYLLLVGKKLNVKQKKRILESSVIENTLVLKTFLDELICFGSYDHLDERIDFYLAATSIPDFFDRMLQRLEEDYIEVPRLLSLIAVSEYGLSEDELIEITGMRQMDFHLFYCAISVHLVNRGGLLVFAHQYITNAILSRYHLEDLDSSKPYREDIIFFFSSKEITDRKRQIAELAFQYYHVEDCENLYKTILSFEAFEYFDSSVEGRALLASYWRKLLKSKSKKYQLRDYLDIPIKGFPVKGVPYLEVGTFCMEYLADYSISIEYSQAYLSMVHFIGGEKSLEMAASYNLIGANAVKNSDYKQALDYYCKALEIQEKKRGIHHPDTAILYNNIGDVYLEQGNCSQALEYHFKALETEERTGRKNYHYLATSYNNLGQVYCRQGDYSQALEYSFKALEIRERILGPNHPSTANTYDNIAFIFNIQGNCRKALEYSFKALKIREEVFGIKHSSTAISYNTIGQTYNKTGNCSKALEYHFKALEIIEELLGTENPQIARTYNCIGGVFIHQGNYPKALEYTLKALNIQEKELGKENPETASTYNDIGQIYQSQGVFSKALEYFLKALEIREKVLGVINPDTANSYNSVGTFYDNQGDYPKALGYYFKALDIWKDVFGGENPHVATSYNNIGFNYNCQGNNSEALNYFFKALEIEKKCLGKDHPNIAISYNNIGEVFSAIEDYSKALEYHLMAVEIWEKVFGLENPNTATSYNNIGMAYFNQGDYTKALGYYIKALKIRESVFGLENLDTASSYNNTGMAYCQLGKYTQAYQCLKIVYHVRKEILGKDHPSTLNAQIGLLQIKAKLDA